MFIYLRYQRRVVFLRVLRRFLRFLRDLRLLGEAGSGGGGLALVGGDVGEVGELLLNLTVRFTALNAFSAFSALGLLEAAFEMRARAASPLLLSALSPPFLPGAVATACDNDITNIPSEKIHVSEGL